MPSNPERIRYPQENKMETTEAYELQIFDIIEKIQDIIETSEGQNDNEPSSIEIQTLNSG
jgi:hypothetical protein